jgi:hypothetical protein
MRLSSALTDESGLWGGAILDLLLVRVLPRYPRFTSISRQARNLPIAITLAQILDASGGGTFPLALPLIRQRRPGQFYFGDLPAKWVNIQPALTFSSVAITVTRREAHCLCPAGRLVLRHFDFLQVRNGSIHISITSQTRTKPIASSLFARGCVVMFASIIK